MTIMEAFLKADEVLLNAVRSISDLIIGSGHVVVDFADVKTIMSERGMAIMGVGMKRPEKTGPKKRRRKPYPVLSSKTYRSTGPAACSSTSPAI